jgi:long-chain acyl-CoA synthetase
MLCGTLGEIKDAIAGEWTGRIGLAGEDQSFALDHVLQFEKLYETAALRHGDPVVIAVDHSLQSVGAVVAAWSMGLVAVPVKSDGGDYASLVDDCRARLVVDARSGNPTAIDQGPRPADKFRIRSPRRVAGTDLALIIYTSGSTGKPKGIMLTHANVLAALYSITRYLGLLPSDRILCVSPLSFDYGLYQLLFSFHTGCSVVLLGKAFNPLHCLKILQSERITVLPVVPSVGTALGRIAGARPSSCPELRMITNTGGHLPDGSVGQLTKAFSNARIVLMYGLSETKRALYLDPAEIARRPGSVGRPMPGMEAKLFREIQDDGGSAYEEVPLGEIGELFLRGPSMMQGYRTSTEASGVRLIGGDYRDDNWLSTGDLFSQDEDGYFYFRGRIKELIKQGGYCLSPRDIEDIVERNPAVAAAVVVGVFDAFGSEVACLVVQTADADVSPTAEKLLTSWIAQNIAADYRPRIVRLANDLPLSANGKVDRGRVRREILEASDGAGYSAAG